MELRYGNHCVYKFSVILFFFWKYRKNFLNDDAVNFLKIYSLKLVQDALLNFMQLIRWWLRTSSCLAEPKYSPSIVIRIIKIIIVRKIFKWYPIIKKQCWDGELWSDEGPLELSETNYFWYYNKLCSKSGDQEERQAYEQMKRIDSQ